MKKKSEKQGLNLVRDRVYSQLEEKYIKENTKWKHVGGKVYKASKLLYWIMSVLTLLTVVLNSIIIYFAAASHYKSGFLDQSAFFKNNIYIVIGLFVSYVLSMIFHRVKMIKTSAIINFIGTIILGIQYFQIAQGGYEIKLMYYYIPAWIMFIASLTLFIIIIKDKNALNKAVNKEIGRIYRHFSESEEELLMTQDDWDSLLIQYEQQELYKERNIKKAKKALENVTIEETETETE